MATPIYTSDLTAVAVVNSLTPLANYAATGGGASALAIEEDYFVHDDACVSKAAFANVTKGIVEDTTNTPLNVGDLSALYLWMTHLTPSSLDTKANGGMAVLSGTSSAALNRYNYAGVDTIDYGADWICAVVDPENATPSSGAIAPIDMNTYGVETKMVGGPTKGAPLGLDTIRQGRSYDFTEGDVTTPATFTGAAAKNDLQANRYGQLQGVKGGFTMQCRMGFGTVTTPVYFEDANKSITLEDLEFVDPNFIGFEVVNVGSTVKWKNITITALGVNTRGNFKVLSSLLVEHDTCTFNGLGTFEYDGNSTPNGTTYRECDQITGGVLTKCTIEKSTNASASLYQDLADLVNCTYIGDGTGHANESPDLIVIDTSMVWSCNFDITGYATIDGSTGNEVLKVNVDTGATLTINVAEEATFPSVNNIGAGTVLVLAGQKTLTITGVIAGESEIRIRDGQVTLLGGHINPNPTDTFIMSFPPYATENAVTLSVTTPGFEYVTKNIKLFNVDVTENLTLEPDPSWVA